ncbi:hypothetical protein QTJ16_000829 [Diplocarpon rosae]|uniref:Uncharacterized protein n=1 Tax=Diplocarpon rosae TaxID=946125 RepID=A0AAD9T7D4_9HELO|nr:hypothetical protein QTJ16_000829 [Diplocarpon rosae]
MNNQAQPPPVPPTGAGAAPAPLAPASLVALIALMALPPVPNPPPFYLANGQVPTAATVQAMSYCATGRARRLALLPVLRQIDFRYTHNANLRLTSDLSSYREAMMVYCVGAPKARPCKMCAKGFGAYVQCIVLPSEPKLNNGCASCHDARHNHDWCHRGR